MKQLAVELLAVALTIGVLFLDFGVALSTEGTYPAPPSLLIVDIASALVVAGIGFATVVITRQFPWILVLFSAWVAYRTGPGTDWMFAAIALSLGLGGLAATLLRKRKVIA